MNKVLFLLVFVCSLSFGKTALQYAREMEASVEADGIEFPFVKTWSDRAMNATLEIAKRELRKKGYRELADQIEFEWEAFYGGTLFQEGRPIGDHPPIIQKINDWYLMIELFLGRPTCRALHISDMLSLNSSNVTVRPCTFPMNDVQGERRDEFRRHFAGGPKGDDYFYGTIPVLVYWSVNIGLTAAGAPIVSALVASVAERLMDIAAAGLSDKIFDARCK